MSLKCTCKVAGKIAGTLSDGQTQEEEKGGGGGVLVIRGHK